MSRAAVAIPCALLALFAACDGATTSWIPLNGKLSGVVSVNTGAVASTPPAPTIGTPFAFSAPPRDKMFALRSAPSPNAETPARPALAVRSLIVSFRPTAFPSALSSAGPIRSRLAVSLPVSAAVVGVSPAILAARVRVTDAAQMAAVTATLQNDPGVAAVTPDRPIWLDDVHFVSAGLPATVPNDLLYPFQSWHYAMVDLPRAWSLTKGNSRVTVAVVDDGMRFDHPAIAANLTSDGYDFVTEGDTLPLCTGGTVSNTGDGGGPDPNPTIPSSYDFTSNNCFKPSTLGAHGLHVAGTIGAVGNDGVGTTGINATVHIRPVRVLGIGGFGRSYDIAQ